MNTQANSLDFEIGDKVYWEIGGNSEFTFRCQGLFMQDNGDGTSKIRLFQRGTQKLSAVLDVITTLLQPHTNTPTELGCVLDEA